MQSLFCIMGQIFKLLEREKKEKKLEYGSLFQNTVENFHDDILKDHDSLLYDKRRENIHIVL